MIMTCLVTSYTSCNKIYKTTKAIYLYEYTKTWKYKSVVVALFVVVSTLQLALDSTNYYDAFIDGQSTHKDQCTHVLTK